MIPKCTALAVNLSYLNNSRIVKARWLGQSISKTVYHAVISYPAVVKTYQTGLSDGSFMHVTSKG